jgi:hypothetical protein
MPPSSQNSVRTADSLVVRSCERLQAKCATSAQLGTLLPVACTLLQELPAQLCNTVTWRERELVPVWKYVRVEH